MTQKKRQRIKLNAIFAILICSVLTGCPIQTLAPTYAIPAQPIVPSVEFVNPDADEATQCLTEDGFRLLYERDRLLVEYIQTLQYAIEQINQ